MITPHTAHMNKLFKYISAIFIIITLISCGSRSNTASIIPKPVSVSLNNNYFTFLKDTEIFFDNNNEELKFCGDYLSNIFKKSTGNGFKMSPYSDFKDSGIVFKLNKKLKTKDDGYKITISTKKIEITAKSSPGIFYGIQTLLQLLPPEIMGSMTNLNNISIPTGKIEDYPRYQWRGTMLDVARHFFTVEEVKRYIDLLALYKINILHLHLTDDQGWRIMIDSWPNLALHGGQTEVGGGPGGYYTKDDYKEIVKYAQDRFITIVPEIDMPGHTNAALASYPELNMDGKAKPLYTGYSVNISTLNTRSEVTYKFVEDVIREIAEITPGKYIHIGGDEAIPDTYGESGKNTMSREEMKAGYKYFIERVEDIVQSHDKIMIGWDDIKAADLDESTIKQIWHFKVPPSKNKVIISTCDRAYLDMKYHRYTKLGLTWAGYIDLDQGYDWDPLEYEPGYTEDMILGIEAPLWSETVKDVKDIEFMAFPRILGYSEIAWSLQENRDLNDYLDRVATEGLRLDFLDVNYYKSELVSWINRD